MIPNLTSIAQLHEIPLQYKRVEVNSEDYEANKIVKEVVDFFGMFTIMKATDVERKEENERRWNWMDLVTTEDISLDNVILGPDDREFLIQSKEPWGPAGFFKYTCAEQPDGL